MAKSWGRANVRRGDEIVISHLEHHANIVPWQQLIAETGATLRVDPGRRLRPGDPLDEYAKLLSDRDEARCRHAGVERARHGHAGRSEIVEMAPPCRRLRAGRRRAVGAAPAGEHAGARRDFFVFSGHKIFGPTGIGVRLRPARTCSRAMPPWQGGGNMIADVTFEKTVYQQPPNRFEAGTGNIADAVGLGAALDYVSRLGMENIAALRARPAGVRDPAAARRSRACG